MVQGKSIELVLATVCFSKKCRQFTPSPKNAHCYSTFTLNYMTEKQAGYYLTFITIQFDLLSVVGFRAHVGNFMEDLNKTMDFLPS